MSISIDYTTKVISVPKAYLTLDTMSPYEIRTLDSNQFHLDLRALEFNEQGILFDATHNHTTIVTLGGTTFARLVEIINGYTLTFEDGSYAVAILGANTNFADVLNLNTVSVRTANTAGLIQVVSGSGVTEQDKLDIADRVWDEVQAVHLTAGTTGKALSDASAGGDTTAIASAVWDMVLYPDHVLDDSAGKYLYEFYSALESGDVWLSTSTPTEIMLVRKRLGDAGTLIAETIIDEEAIATNADTIFTMYQMLFEVNGVWLRDDTEHTGTNYFSGVDAKFDTYTGQLTLHTSLPSENEEVLISYTYYRGLHDEFIDEFLTEGKLYVRKYTGHDYDWTQAFLETPDEETKIAMLAAASLAASRCLEALAASDILQLGFNFRLGDLEIENMVRGGGFQVQAHIDMLKGDVDRWLKILGRSMYFAAGSTKGYGRDAWGYHRKGTSNRRSDIR